MVRPLLWKWATFAQMHLFYFSCDCFTAQGGLDRKMMADVFVKEHSLSQAEARLKEYLAHAGWRIKAVQHWELDMVSRFTTAGSVL